MSAAKPGDLVAGRYRIEAPIGSGAYATVFRARDETLARGVAIKFLFIHDERKREFLRDRFLREARIAAAVDHPNVARTIDFGAEGDRPYMIMELLQGPSLAERMERAPAPSIGELADIACEILAGLDAIHRAGIVHRDLKPDNVILVRDGDLARAKIVDFGVSRALQPQADVRSALTTRNGLVVGTPEYMSPEQARGLGEVDPRADLYAMGAILYEALTGRLPYRAPNMGDLIVAIARGGAPSVHQLRPDVPEALSRVVERAMALAPEDRYASAGDMARALIAATGRAAPTAAQGSWLPGRAGARATVSEYTGARAGVTGGPPPSGSDGTADVSEAEVDRAIREAELSDSARSREAARAPTLEAGPESLPPQARAQVSRAPGPPAAPLTAPAPGGAPPPRTPAPLVPPPPPTSMRPRRQTPPAVPGSLPAAVPPAVPGLPAQASFLPASSGPALPPTSMRPRRQTPPAVPGSPAPAVSVPAPPPSRPVLASIQAQLDEARAGEDSKVPALALARVPGFRRPGIASNRPRVGIARSGEPDPSRGVGRWLFALFVGLAGLALWAVASREDGRAALDRASRAIARAVPALGSYVPFRKTVEVNLVGVPLRARIRLDGTLIPSDVFEVPRDGALHLVEVELGGMETWRASFEAERDLTYHVVLVERLGGRHRFE